MSGETTKLTAVDLAEELAKAHAELHAAREAILGAVEFAESIVKWLVENGHGPAAPIPDIHSHCFACGVIRKSQGVISNVKDEARL